MDRCALWVTATVVEDASGRLVDGLKPLEGFTAPCAFGSACPADDLSVLIEFVVPVGVFWGGPATTLRFLTC